MAFTPTSYNDCIEAIKEIGTEVKVAKDASKIAINKLRLHHANIVKLGQPAANGGWADVVAYVNAQAAANPDDEDWKRMQSHLAKIVQDFNDLRKKVEAIITAIDGVPSL